MTTRKTIPEEWLSAYFDGECTVEEKAAVEKMLQEEPESRVLLDNFHALRDALRSSASEPPGFTPIHARGLIASAKDGVRAGASADAASAGAPEPAIAALDRETLQQLLSDRDRMHERSARAMAWTAALSGIAGMAVAFLIGGFFFWNALERRPAPEVRIVTPPSAPVAALPAPPAAPVMQAGVKAPLQEPPLPEIEALATTPNSCIIENINAADDINTAVFQIPDENGEMITVIWLTGIDAGNTI